MNELVESQVSCEDIIWWLKFPLPSNDVCEEFPKLSLSPINY